MHSFAIAAVLTPGSSDEITITGTPAMRYRDHEATLIAVVIFCSDQKTNDHEPVRQAAL